MPFLGGLFKPKDGSSSRNKGNLASHTSPAVPPKPKWEEAWARTSVSPNEVQELLHVCTQELKSRALDMPFLLLPFRPEADPSGSKNFIRNFFKAAYSDSDQYKGDSLRKELRLIDPVVLCSIMKWCWSRLPGGVVGWNTYDLFNLGEKKSNMAKHAFDTFIPLSTSSEALTGIIFDFFDLLAAVSANAKTNGLGGRKLSRLAGWWAFEHADNGRGFDGGYRSWAKAADATSHMYFAYLRSRAPDTTVGTGGISQLPRSLQALVSQTEYPPEIPSLLQSEAPKVVMIVDSVSPTPFALLRRAKHFEYNDSHRTLQAFSEYDDPIRALTFECRRVLNAISSANQSAVQPLQDVETSGLAQIRTDSTWSLFEDTGFSSVLDGTKESQEPTQTTGSPKYSQDRAMLSVPSTGHNDLGRPTTPSWADFMSSGFADDATTRGPTSLLLPPDQMLPPLHASRGIHSSQSHLRNGLQDDNLEPGELASISQFELDETFWWVWMSSLAAEEPALRKGAFGRCAFIETEITGGRWVVMEEQVKGAAEPDEGAVLVEKKSRSLFSRRSRSRRQSTGKQLKPMAPMNSSEPVPARRPITSEQQAKVDAAAAALVREEQTRKSEKTPNTRRGRHEGDDSDSKTTSVMTLQPVIMKEAGPAMQWARKFDKESVRSKYLGDPEAGRGSNREASPSPSRTMTSQKNTVVPAGNTSSQQLPPPEDGTQQTLDSIKSYYQQPAAQPELAASSPVTSQKDTPSSPIQSKDLNHTHRKPLSTDLSQTQQDPSEALQEPEAEQPVVNSSLAPPGEASSPRLEKSRKGSTRALKNLFQRKKPEEAEAIIAHRKITEKSRQDAAEAKALKHSESKSQRNKNVSTASTQVTAPDMPEPEPRETVHASTPVLQHSEEDLEGGEPGPMIGRESEDLVGGEAEQQQVPMHQSPYAHENSTARGSTSNFSNFTSGPTDEQAAYLPDGFVSSTHAHSTSMGSIPAKDFHSASQSYTGEAESESNNEPTLDPLSAVNDVLTQPRPEAINADRWAQIRKNAAERRNNSQENGSASARFSQSARTDRTDDGETSGEETIESRVARIKARVAELTANSGRLE